MIIKVFLIGSVILGCLWLLRGHRQDGRLALTRLGGLLLAAGWIVAVISPDAVTWVAQLVGVGRGTDLVLYVTVVAFMFSSVRHHRRFSELDSRIAVLTRASAIQEQELRAALGRDDPALR